MVQDEINVILKDAIKQFNRKNTQDSQDLFYQVLEKDPMNPEANYYLGLIYSKEGNDPKSVLHLKNVVDMGTSFLYTQQCRMILGLVYFRNKEYKRAELEFLEVIKSNVKTVQVYASLACVYYYMNEKEECRKYSEKAYSMEPFNLNAKNTFAFILCDYKIDVPKGLEMLREVVRIKPGNPAYLDSLGWAYYRKGDVKAAMMSLKKALELSHKNPVIEEHYRTVMRNG